MTGAKLVKLAKEGTSLCELMSFMKNVCASQKRSVVGTNLREAVPVIGAIGGDGKAVSDVPCCFYQITNLGN